MLDMELLAARRDVASPERLVAGVADEVQSSEVVALAQRVLLAILGFDREELCSDDDVTVLQQCKENVSPQRTTSESSKQPTHLTSEAVEVVYGAQRAHERARDRLSTSTARNASVASCRCVAVGRRRRAVLRVVRERRGRVDG